MSSKSLLMIASCSVFLLFLALQGAAGAREFIVPIENNNINITYDLKNLENSDEKQRVIEFEVVANTRGWVGIALNKADSNGQMWGADFFIGSVNAEQQVTGGDFHVKATEKDKEDGNRVPQRDPDNSQDWKELKGNGTDTVTTLIFSRVFDTGDEEHDVKVLNDTQWFLWAYGKFNEEGSEWVKHDAQGALNLNLVLGKKNNGGMNLSQSVTLVTILTAVAAFVKIA